MSRPSLALRQARQEIEALKASIRDLIQSGGLMSNVCYNLSQQNEVPPGWRELAKRRQLDWDATVDLTRRK